MEVSYGAYVFPTKLLYIPLEKLFVIIIIDIPDRSAFRRLVYLFGRTYVCVGGNRRRRHISQSRVLSLGKCMLEAAWGEGGIAAAGIICFNLSATSLVRALRRSSASRYLVRTLIHSVWGCSFLCR